MLRGHGIGARGRKGGRERFSDTAVGCGGLAGWGGGQAGEMCAVV